MEISYVSKLHLISVVISFQGRLAVGSDADVVVWDPSATSVISRKDHSAACDFNVFEGLELQGAPLIVISNGQ